MKYAKTQDGRIHQVCDETEFYKYNPTAVDVTLMPNVYTLFEEQQSASKRIKEVSIYFKETGEIVQVVDVETGKEVIWNGINVKEE